MKVVITGSNGYLGARLFEYFKKNFEGQVYGTYLSGGSGAETEQSNTFLLDITQRENVERVFAAIKPDVVIHSAAIAHGDSSNDSSLLKEVNIKGTENVVEEARKYNSKILYVSTIGALTNSEYGKSKLQGEKIVQNSFLEYCIVRPSLIIGISPNRDPAITFNNIVESIKSDVPVILDSEWKFQPSWIDHVTEVIFAWVIGRFTDQGPIYPLVPEVKSRFEVAQDLLSHFDKTATAIENPRYEENELIGQESLVRNNLPVYSYQNIIDIIVKQIKEMKV